MSKEETIKKNIETILDMMGMQVTIDVTLTDNQYVVAIKTEAEAPYLIGKYGETLSAIQRIVEAMLYKTYNEPVSVLVNVNDYRERQKERLEGIAENVATRAITEKRTVTLRSFSPYERKLIHEYISTKYPELTTFSEGEGYDRRLNVGLKTDASE